MVTWIRNMEMEAFERHQSNTDFIIIIIIIIIITIIIF